MAACDDIVERRLCQRSCNCRQCMRQLCVRRRDVVSLRSENLVLDKPLHGELYKENAAPPWLSN